jgi:thiol-disulfide isomerase/thioredoxin
LKRMNNRIWWVLAVSCLLFASCGGRKTAAPLTRTFPSVQVPQMGSDQDKVDYAVIHFWDAFMDTSKTFTCDSSIVNGVKREELEKVFGQYASMLNAVQPAVSVSSMDRMFKMAVRLESRDTSSNVFEAMTEMSDKYLYDPNSPVRNEEAYLSFARDMSECGFVDSTLRKSYDYSARMCSLNRIGQKATDFTFTGLTGKKMTLFGIKADITLLFFSNPGCPACEGITKALIADRKVNDLIASGKLAVANVYIDQELDKWRAFAKNYPTTWLTGYDQNYIIRTDVLYNVRAIPSLYLLDKDKKVIMKDAPQENVLSYLDNLPD